VKKISLSDYQDWTKKTQWTFVHGDFHPANFMWLYDGDKNNLKFLDWEMVGVGSGPQELAQYLVSHMSPAKRRECESGLIKLYHDELIRNGVPNTYTLADCTRDYVRGGSERWMWFLAYFLDFPQDVMDYFCDQTLEFCKDHNVTCENIGQVRP